MSSIEPTRLLDAIQAVHERFVAERDDTDRGEVLEVALQAALELTGSALGFVARVRDHGSQRVLTPECVHAVDPRRHGNVSAWLYDTLEASARGETIPRPLAQLTRAEEPVLLDYEPRLPPLDNFMALPLARGDRRGEVIAVVALANRPEGFTRELAQDLGPLLAACRTVLVAYEGAEQRAAREAELERSERRFRTFMDTSPCVAYITDTDRKVVWVSRAFGEQFHVDPAEAVGRREEELIPVSMVGMSRAIDDQVRAADGFVEMLEPAIDANGEIHWWQGAKFPLDGPSGERLIGSLALDVTENVRMNDALRERESALAEAQELARLGRWTWNVTHDSLHWDSQFEDMCGQPDAPGRGIDALLDLLHPDDVETTRAAIEQLVREGSSRRTLEHRLLVDGEIRDLYVVARVSRESDEGETVIAVAQDVSDRRKLERSRRELESKALKFESLSVLAGGMAHEFKHLLVSILGNAGIAYDDVAPDSLAAACVQDIEAAAERAAALTRQMLAFSGRGRFVREELELSSLVTDLSDLVHASTSDATRVRFELHPDLPPVDGDLEQLRQLVTNLVINASEAIGETAGELTVATGVDEFTAIELEGLVEELELSPGRYVWLEIRDTGSGMDDATRGRIFEPFFSTKAAGRGLGLAAALGIVRSHQGGLIVVSRPGAGASFRVLLPLARAARPSRGESWSSTA